MQHKEQIDITPFALPPYKGEQELLSLLQKPIAITTNQKVLRRGRLILFRRIHYFIQLTLLTKKKEHFELPIPFFVECDFDKNHFIFDYRPENLNIDFISTKNASPFLGTIVYIKVEDDAILSEKSPKRLLNS